MTWETRDLGLAAYITTQGVECLGVEIRQDRGGRDVGYFQFLKEPSELILQWVNRQAAVEPQEYVYRQGLLKKQLFLEMGSY